MKKDKGKPNGISPKDYSNGNDFLDDDYEEPKKWFEEIAEDPKQFDSVTEQVLIDLKDEAKRCHDSEVANYNIKHSKTNSNYQWMKTVMSKGTVSDKIAAHTVTIQDNPICNLETLRNLVSMVRVGKKKECFTVIETLTELFLDYLLRPNQKLRAFHQRPLSKLNDLTSGNAIGRRKILSAWYFEDQLKEVYTQFVLALNTAAHDTVDANKEKAITAMFKLLAGNPEQEKNLLSHIINKLGDPSQKVASKAIYCLTQLLFKHPNMQSVVLNEVEKLLFRPNVASRAQYYCLCFISQFYLSQDSTPVAQKLIELYFSFFKACIKKGDVDTRMMSALLMGINRAFPYAKMEYEKISEHIDTMYRLVHLANFNIGLHALTLLYQVSDCGNKITDRFYSALYRKLADSKLFSTTYQAMLLSLIYKALLKDKEINRVKVFVKRLLQIASYSQAGFACGVLYLVSQLIGKRPEVQSLLLQEQPGVNFEDEDDTEEKYHDVEEIEIKEEPLDEEEIDRAESEKPLQIDDSIIKIDEEEDIKPDKEVLDESFKGSWFHAKNKVKVEKNVDKYNPLVRNPLYAGGEFTAFMELSNLRNHFHPTVALYASNILKGEVIKYSGDPLKDFTLIRFLDRFVFKNPKKPEENVGAHPTFGRRKFYKPKGVRLMSVKSSGYVKENEQNIPVDELFVHAYLQRKYKDSPENLDEDNSDVESVQSEEFEEMLDKMTGLKDDDEDMDFMNEIKENMKTKDKKKGKKDEDIDDNEESDDEEETFDDEEDFDDEEEEEIDEDDKELIGDLDDDDEDIDFGDLSEDEEVDTKAKIKQKYKMKKGDDISSLFASADEFASLLEDEGSSNVKSGSSNVFENKDNAHMKQLDWEDKRNNWIRGFDKTVRKGKFGGGKKNLGKRKSNFKKNPGGNKKFKK